MYTGFIENKQTKFQYKQQDIIKDSAFFNIQVNKQHEFMQIRVKHFYDIYFYL